MSNALELKWKQEEEREKLANLNKLHERLAIAKNIADKLEASLKPSGYYKIPEILDKRRLEYAIPNGAFEVFPTFDRVFVYQIVMDTDEGETYGDSLILKPEQRRAWDRNTSPRGILVAAGLKAMDALYSTGCEIGHIVRFKKFAPFEMTVDQIDGHEIKITVLRDGDVEGSEDLQKEVNEGRARVVNVSKDGFDFRIERNGSVSGRKIDEYYDPSV